MGFLSHQNKQLSKDWIGPQAHHVECVTSNNLLTTPFRERQFKLWGTKFNSTMTKYDHREHQTEWEATLQRVRLLDEPGLDRHVSDYASSS